MIDFIKVKKIRPNAVIPTYGSIGAAGSDLFACIDHDVVISAGESAFIPTGIALQIPCGFAGLIYARSGMACKRNLAPANKVGVVDSDYRGEIIVVLHNHGTQEQLVQNGDRIAQLVITPVVTPSFEICDDLSETDRNAGGFGSTGK